LLYNGFHIELDNLMVARSSRKNGFSGLLGDPAWEKSKSARRNLDHDDAVNETAHLQRQTLPFGGERLAQPTVDLYEILQTLTRKKIPFVLTGAHAIAGWTGRPRNTQDVDILVRGGRNYARAVHALQSLYPVLETRQFSGLTAFFVPGEKSSLIDVVYPHRADIAYTLESAIWVTEKNRNLRYRVPSLESALANKYGAMVTISRSLVKRAQDAVDFMAMVRHSMDAGRAPIHLDKLVTLGALVWPEGGGTEIRRLVEQIVAGKAIDLNSLAGSQG
jgi:hypothetical protein